MDVNLNTKLQSLSEDLSKYGYCIIDNVFDLNSFANLESYFNQNLKHLKPAAIGQKSSKVINENIRTDSIFWLNENAKELSPYFHVIGLIKSILKRECFLPIKRHETQMACYEIGSFYTRHQDRHLKSEHRWVSVVFYFNTEWKTSDGGELIIYEQNKDKNSEVIVQPIGNRMVIFLSELEHEVVMTHQVRKSFTTWFRDDL